MLNYVRIGDSRLVTTKLACHPSVICLVCWTAPSYLSDVVIRLPVGCGYICLPVACGYTPTCWMWLYAYLLDVVIRIPVGCGNIPTCWMWLYTYLLDVVIHLSVGCGYIYTYLLDVVIRRQPGFQDGITCGGLNDLGSFTLGRTGGGAYVLCHIPSRPGVYQVFSL